MEPAAPRVRVETFAVGPLGCNCSIVSDEATKEAIVVDPGDDADRIRQMLRRAGLTVRAIVHTHTHIDHVGATAQVQRETGAPVLLHDADVFLYRMLPVQARLIGLSTPEEATIDRMIRDGDTIRAGSIELAVVHTPGHTPGSVCFLAPDAGIVFAGDTLFSGSIGRTDLWGGDTDAILQSIRGRLLTLPGETRVVCGHGPDTTIEREAISNPFVGRDARD